MVRRARLVDFWYGDGEGVALLPQQAVLLSTVAGTVCLLLDDSDWTSISDLADGLFAIVGTPDDADEALESVLARMEADGLVERRAA